MFASNSADKAKKIVNSLKERSFVFINDITGLESKLERLSSGTASLLQVVCDFDYTISKYVDANGERLLTTHDAFDQFIKSNRMELYEQIQMLREKYLPIEFSSLLTVEEKIPHMETWWRLAHTCIVRAGFSATDFEALARLARIELRDGFTDFVTWAERNSVPITVFSAGIGNVIREILSYRFGRIPLNMRIIGNEFKFDDFGIICGFTEPLIHTYNKKISVVNCKDEFLGSLKTRGNIVLFGDTLGDARMDLGLGDNETVLKIGFLNHTVDALKESYMRAYDIVIEDPSNFDTASEMLFSLLGH